VIEAASIVDQDLTTDASVAFADVYVPDGGTFGIVGNELLTVNAAGTFAFSGIAGITVEDADYIGNSAASARLGFDSSGAIDYAYFLGCNIGIGTAGPGNSHLYVTDATLTSTATFYGVRGRHIKTGGAGAVTDDYYGAHFYMALNQATTIDNMFGLWSEAILVQGTLDVIEGVYAIATVTAGTVNVNVRGADVNVNLDGGTITGSVYGQFTYVDVEAAVTSIGGGIYGNFIQVDADENPTGSVYMLFLNELTGIDFGVYQDGTAVNYFGGNVGVGIAAPDSRLHVDQSNAGGAIPVLHLDQADEDVVLAKITAIAAAASADRTLVADSDFGTPGALVGWIQIEIQDDGNRVADGDYYIPFYAVPT